MGGHLRGGISFLTRKDVAKSLEALRQRELKAGRYNLVSSGFLRFPVDERHQPGGKHASAEAARAAASASGTRSILDMMRVGAGSDFGTVAPLDEMELMDLFGTAQPTAEDVEDSDELFDQLERGQGVYVVIYEDDEPSQLFFGGYSYD